MELTAHLTDQVMLLTRVQPYEPEWGVREVCYPDTPLVAMPVLVDRCGLASPPVRNQIAFTSFTAKNNGPVSPDVGRRGSRPRAEDGDRINGAASPRTDCGTANRARFSHEPGGPDIQRMEDHSLSRFNHSPTSTRTRWGKTPAKRSVCPDTGCNTSIKRLRNDVEIGSAGMGRPCDTRDRLGRIAKSWTVAEETLLFRLEQQSRGAIEGEFWQGFASRWGDVWASNGFPPRTANAFRCRFSLLKKKHWICAWDRVLVKVRENRAPPRFIEVSEGALKEAQSRCSQGSNDKRPKHPLGGPQDAGEASPPKRVRRSAGLKASEASCVEMHHAIDTDVEITAPADPETSLSPNPTDTDEGLGTSADSASAEQVSRTSEGSGEDWHVADPDFETFLDVFLDSVRRYKAPRREQLRIQTKKVKECWWTWANVVAERHIGRCKSLRQVNSMVYALGKAIETLSHRGTYEAKKKHAEWAVGIRKEIGNLRKHIGWISDEIKRRRAGARPTRKQIDNFCRIRKKYERQGKSLRSASNLRAKLEFLKGHMHVLLQKIEHDKCSRIAYQSRDQSAKAVLNPRSESRIGSVELIRDYWATIVGKRLAFRGDPRIGEWANELSERVRPQSLAKDKQETWRFVLRKAKSFKAPGPDGIPGALWKKVTVANRYLLNWIPRAERKCPKWLPQGRVVLLPKGGDSSKPENYRPIACLNTCYKLITAFITEQLLDHLNSNHILPENQRALVRSVWGCTDAIATDRAIAISSQISRRSDSRLHAVWVDYSKAFDSISHSYLNYVLKVCKVHKSIRRLLAQLMSGWKVRYEVRVNSKKMQSKPLQIRRGVLQGDTLSPLLFCLAIAPISHVLNSQIKKVECVVHHEGQVVSTVALNHMFYMDDFKGYSRETGELERMICLLTDISRTMGLEINPKKSAVLLDKESGATSSLPELGEGSYKYLGIEERLIADLRSAGKRVAERIISGTSALLGANRAVGKARNDYNSVIIPAARYFFANAIAGKKLVVRQREWAISIDQKVRKLLRQHKYRYMHSCLHRLYLPAAMGGLGFKSVERTLFEATLYSWCYVQCKANMEFVREVFRKKRVRYGITHFAHQILAEHNLAEMVREAPNRRPGLLINDQLITHPTIAAREIVKLLKKKWNESDMRVWLEKPLAGRVLRNGNVDKRLSFLWLKNPRVGCITFRNVIAAQEGLIGRHADKYPSCRHCGHKRENAKHIAACCERYRTSLMISRHDSVVRVVLCALCRKFGLSTPHPTQPVLGWVVENERAKICCDVRLAVPKVRAEVSSDGVKKRLKFRSIRCDRPDIVVFDKMEKVIKIAEIGVSWHTELVKADSKKFHKYATDSTVAVEDEMKLANPSTRSVGPNLKGLMEEMYGKEYPEVRVIPLVIGACGEVMPSILDRMKKLDFTEQECRNVLERMQVGAVSGTSRLIRVHLSTKA